MFRKFVPPFGIGIALLAAVIAGHRPATSTADRSTKFDQLIRDEVQRGSSEPVRVLLTTRREASPRIRERLAALGATASLVPYSPDLIVASNLSAQTLADFARDPDVLRVSSDASVRSFGTVDLSKNTLLGTEGLLTGSGSISIRSNPYTGRNIGVAVVDSGFFPSTDLDGVTASYTFLTGTAVKQGPKDAFGHGTHVSGLIGSNGSTTGGRYQGIAPDVRFI
jgi:serine protease AprX